MELPKSVKPRFPQREEYGPITAADAPTDALAWKTVRGWLSDSRYYWIVTTRPDGRPHAIAVWGVWLDPTFYFMTSPQTVTARNIKRNKSGLLHLESAADVAIVEGTLTRPEPESLSKVVSAYEAKYGWRMDPHDAGMPFYALRAHMAMGWKAQDPRGSSVRWIFE